MKQATATIENTSDYVRGEIERKKAIHKKDVMDLIRDEHNAYYQKALDSSLAYDDLALHGEPDLEKVREAVHLTSVSSGIHRQLCAARSFDLPSNKRFPAPSTTTVLPANSGSIAGETCQD